MHTGPQESSKSVKQLMNISMKIFATNYGIFDFSPGPCNFLVKAENPARPLLDKFKWALPYLKSLLWFNLISRFKEKFVLWLLIDAWNHGFQNWRSERLNIWLFDLIIKFVQPTHKNSIFWTSSSSGLFFEFFLGCRDRVKISYAYWPSRIFKIS